MTRDGFRASERVRARRNTAVSDYYPNGNGVAGTAGSSAGGVLKGAATGGATASGTLSGSTGLAANLNAATYTRYSGSPATLRFSADGYVYAPTTGARVYQWKTGGGVQTYTIGWLGRVRKLRTRL